MPHKWYALRVKPHKERSVYELLNAQSFDLFLPLIRVKPKNPRAAKQRPFFPGYLFVHTDLDEIGENLLNHIPGSHGLVSFGGDPAVVPSFLMEELIERVGDINDAGGMLSSDLAHGDRVRIVSGPFAGYEAIFDMALPGRDRAQILLAFLSNYPQPVQIHTTDIEKL